MSRGRLKDEIERAETTLNNIYVKAAQEKIILSDPKIANVVKRLEKYIEELRATNKLMPKGERRY